MQGHPVRGPTDRIRLAELTLDSDQSPDVDLLVSAARDAIALTNVTLGERLARAAVNRGGGLVASELLARSLLWQGNAAEAEETLSAFDPDQMNELELVRWGLVRIANLHWSMGDAEGADDVLDLLCDRVAHPGLKLVVAGVASASRLFENQLEEAVELSKLVLACPDASAAAVEWAVFGGALALALMGRGEEVEAVADEATSSTTRSTGCFATSPRSAKCARSCSAATSTSLPGDPPTSCRITSAGQYLAWGMANVLVGTVELGRGRFADTVSRMEQTVAALTSESAASWSFPARLLLAQSYCALARADAGAKMVAELRTRSGKHVAVFAPAAAHRRVVAGRRGGKRQRRNRTRARCRTAGGGVQTDGHRDACAARRGAVRRPDLPGPAGRARREHRRQAGVGHRGARTAVRDRDAVKMCEAAHQFEQIGALLSAADASAQAAVAAEACDDRRRSVEAAAAATRLAAECGGIRTPALDLAAHPLPLTVREREIANLVAAGLSNKDIADRLVVSVRTVEGHLYRACIKLDISDREDLAAMIRTGATA